VVNFTVLPAFAWRKSFDRMAGVNVRYTIRDFLGEKQELNHNLDIRVTLRSKLLDSR
jgi:hypothetical protein